MATFGSRLAEQKGVGPGFDAVRITLALSVLFIHAGLMRPATPEALIAPVVPFAPLQQWAFDFAILPMFFALSGFLVAGSTQVFYARLPTLLGESGRRITGVGNVGLSQR